MRLSIFTSLLGAAILAIVWSSSASGQSTLVQWNFNNQTSTPSTLDPNFLTTPTVSALNTGLSSYQTVGNNGSSDPEQGINPSANYALQASGFPAQGTGSGTAGFEYQFNTTNYTLSSFSYDFAPAVVHRVGNNCSTPPMDRRGT